jgi:hypothetical protein
MQGSGCYIEDMNANPAVDEESDLLEDETPRQTQFREDMEAEGIEVRTYSGRGMFGERTYAVACYRNGGRSGHQPSEQDVYRATELRLLQDSLGMGTILYVRG